MPPQPTTRTRGAVRSGFIAAAAYHEPGREGTWTFLLALVEDGEVAVPDAGRTQSRGSFVKSMPMERTSRLSGATKRAPLWPEAGIGVFVLPSKRRMAPL